MPSPILGLARRRTVVWFSVTLLTVRNAPLDLIEWLAWGRQFAWGYPKHPPLPAWLAALANWTTGDVWGVYLLSYVLIAIALWCAWRVGLEFLSPRLALIGAVCMDGLLYLTRDPAEYSNNIVLDTTWAFAILCFIRAVRSDQLRWWIGLGITIGLGLLSKYTIGLLGVILAGYVIYDRPTRAQLRRPGPYLAVLIASVLFLPHVIWLVRSNFITFEYAAERSESLVLASHVINPIQFSVGQLLRLLPVLVILAPLWNRSSERRSSCSILDWAVVGPVIALLVLSVVSGRQIRDIWGSPLWTMLGVWLLAKLGTVSPKRLRASARNWALVSAAVIFGCVAQSVAGPYFAEKPNRMHYPGQMLADEISRLWSTRCSSPLQIVAGEPWRAGNVCCYSDAKPAIYSRGEMGKCVFEPRFSPWTNDADLATRGGVILWDAGRYGHGMPAHVRLRFPTAEWQTPVILPYQTGR